MAGDHEGSGIVLPEEVQILVQIQIAEHPAVFHVVTMEQGVGVGKVLIAAGVDEDAARQREIAVHIGVDIGEVILALKNGVINLCMIEGKPRLHILIDAQELGKGRAFLLGVLVDFGFELDHVVLNVFSGGIDLVIVPQAVARVCPGDQERKAHSQTDQTIGESDEALSHHATPFMPVHEGRLSGRGFRAPAGVALL